ncbi:MAG: helix-turn-helix domain-containing protein [Burkholderiaceae bacterium]
MSADSHPRSPRPAASAASAASGASGASAAAPAERGVAGSRRTGSAAKAASLRDADRVHAPKQARGLARQRDLIEAGLALLQTRSLDEITMEQVAAEAGCSVGNLYKRFASKEALLAVLLDTVRERLLADIDAMAARIDGRRDGLAGAVRDVVRLEVEVMRRYRGLLRGLAAHRLRDRSLREPRLADIRARCHASAVTMLLPLMGRGAVGGPDHASMRARLEFALEASLGSLIEMTVFAGGPRDIDDPDIISRMSDMVLASLVPLQTQGARRAG